MYIRKFTEIALKTTDLSLFERFLVVLGILPLLSCSAISPSYQKPNGYLEYKIS